MEPRVGGAHRRGELWVLGKRPLDLLEQPLLVLRERHGTPPRSRGRSGVGSTSPWWQPGGCLVASLRGPHTVGKRDDGPAVPFFFHLGPAEGTSGRPARSSILLSWRWSTVSVDPEPVFQQARRAHDVGAEPGCGGVGGPLGVAPAV